MFEHGQNVRDIFVEADFFVRVSNETHSTIKKRIKRFIDLIFNTSIITPTNDETAMYAAKSASTNSACLSRQVGASITDSLGVILSTGWNDVPKFGGNLYTESDKIDFRCFKSGKCFNDSTKLDLVEDIVQNIISDKSLANAIKGNLLEKLKIQIKKSKVKDLIEFSRSVHAEMHAIIIASQISGTKILNGTLYCTTFPCHNCARHIIASGITKVLYIEPYVKSLCLKLHKEEMTDKEKGEETIGKVKILIFEGVAPRRYLDFFSMKGNRKDKGVLIVNKLDSIKPKTSITLQALATLERQAIITIKPLIDK